MKAALDIVVLLGFITTFKMSLVPKRPAMRNTTICTISLTDFNCLFWTLNIVRERKPCL